MEDPRRDLRRFEQELRAASLAPISVHTYVNQSEVFVRWLSGDHTPRGPLGAGTRASSLLRRGNTVRYLCRWDIADDIGRVKGQGYTLLVSQ